MKYFLSTVFSAIIWVLIAVLAFFVGSGLYQHFISEKSYNGFFGIGYAVVVSGSMEPNIHVDDLIIYQEKDTEDYELDDVVVYESLEEDETILITHRLIQINEDTFVTQGDANTVADDPIKKDQVVGRIVWRLSYVGVVVDFVKTPIGYVTVALTIVLLIFFNIILGKSREKQPEKARKKSEKQKQ